MYVTCDRLSIVEPITWDFHDHYTNYVQLCPCELTFDINSLVVNPIQPGNDLLWKAVGIGTAGIRSL